jgi:hypothetical protein
MSTYLDNLGNDLKLIQSLKKSGHKYYNKKELSKLIQTIEERIKNKKLQFIKDKTKKSLKII